MRLDSLFAALDARPFRPFTIELASGRLIAVGHSDNVFVIPNRQTVHHVEVYNPDTEWRLAIVYPEGISAILFNGSPVAERSLPGRAGGPRRRPATTG